MKQHFSQSLPRGELWTVRRLALAHTVTEICTTSFVNFVILIVCKNSYIFNLRVCEWNNIFHNLYLVVNSELSVVKL